MKDFSESINDYPIPHLRELRRAPLCYRHILPLSIVKQYQCLVVGAAKGKLTIAITNTQNMEMLESLGKYTGKTIFPVLIDPRRMQLLIRRIERGEQCRGNCYLKRHQAKGIGCHLYTLKRLEINSMLMLITSQKAKGLRKNQR